MKIRNIAIIENDTKVDAHEITVKLIEKLQDICEIQINTITKDTQLIFSVGGDGTMIRTLKNYQNIPTIGINGGTLGYLTELTMDNFCNSIYSLLEGCFVVDECNTLKCSLYRNDECIYEDIAVNDVVIERKPLHMIRFDAYIDGQKIKQYHSNGFIVSTPIGSSGYALSCGGALIEQKSKIIEMVPIAEHTFTRGPVIMDDDVEIKIVINELREDTNDAVLAFDGAPRIDIHPNDVIVIKRANSKSHLVRLTNQSFIENLSKKLS